MTGKKKNETPSTESRFDKNSCSGEYIYSNGGKDEFHANDYKTDLVEEPGLEGSGSNSNQQNGEAKEFSQASENDNF